MRVDSRCINYFFCNDSVNCKNIISVCDEDVEVPSRITASSEVHKRKENFEIKIKEHSRTIKSDITLTSGNW